MADVMTPAQRSLFMSGIRPKGTALEVRVFRALRKAGVRFNAHLSVLPRCTPDIVFRRTRVVVFIDGDFWHGWRFPAWKKKLAPFWQHKIGINRARDQRTRRALRRAGWRVLRVWEHEIERDLESVIARILAAGMQPQAAPTKSDEDRAKELRSRPLRRSSPRRNPSKDETT